MKNQYAVFVGDDEYRTEEFYDKISGSGGVDIYAPNGDYIGELFGIEIPDIDDSEECQKFSDEIESWLSYNYF